MTGVKRKFVGCSSVGSPPKRILEDVETIKFVVHGFRDRTEKRAEEIVLSALQAHGYRWRLTVCPRGDTTSPSDTEYVSCFLEYAGDTKYEPTVKFALRCKKFEQKSYTASVFVNGKLYGTPQFLDREDVLSNYLEADGSLVIEVDIQIAAESKLLWYPDKLQREESLTQLYRNASDTADVVFLVDGMEYHAHRIILSLRAKALFELSKEYDGQEHVPISNLKGDTFQKILIVVYTVKTPEMDDEATAKEILAAADRFDCTHLKLYAESVIVDKFLTTANAATLLVLGDSMSCALLKEAAMNTYASDPSAVMESSSEGWPNILDSKRLLAELLESVSLKLGAANRNTNTTNSNNNNDDDDDISDTVTVAGTDNIDQLMNVTSLREKLEEAKLEVDGSREILVDRLKKQQEREKAAC